MGSQGPIHRFTVMPRNASQHQIPQSGKTGSAPVAISVSPWAAPLHKKARLSPQLRNAGLPGRMGLDHVMFWTSALAAGTASNRRPRAKAQGGSSRDAEVSGSSHDLIL